MQNALILFDVDGVLVQPGGYREAVRATIHYFTHQMGLTNLAPTDAELAVFEAQGITCEWDMIPITLAYLLDRAVEQSGLCPSFDSLAAACAWLFDHPPGALSVDYGPFFRSLGRLVRVGEAPADTLLALSQERRPGAPFAHLAGQDVLNDLLANSRRPARSWTTHVFQNYVLGTEIFTRMFGLKPELASESLLERHDRPLLRPDLRDRLLELRRRGRLGIAAYTARPSLPFEPPAEPLAVFMPEAEMALELAGLDGIPIIGSGQMGEAAHRLGEHEDRLVKPSPYHALFALISAATGDRQAALLQTLQIFRRFEQGGPAPALNGLFHGSPARPLELHIFEDSPSGMQGGKAAAVMLEQLGVSARLHLWGVTTHSEKIRALEMEGALVSPDVNAALLSMGL